MNPHHNRTSYPVRVVLETYSLVNDVTLLLGSLNEVMPGCINERNSKMFARNIIVMVYVGRIQHDNANGASGIIDGIIDEIIDAYTVDANLDDDTIGDILFFTAGKSQEILDTAEEGLRTAIETAIRSSTEGFFLFSEASVNWVGDDLVLIGRFVK